MLKVSRTGRRRSNSFSLLDTGDLPVTPMQTPSSSFVPESMLEHKIFNLHMNNHDELLKVAEEMILRPTQIEAEDIEFKEKLNELKELCKGFHLNDEQLRHIEKRMVMEINWGLGRFTNPSSNIKSYITYVSDLPTGKESGTYLALDLGGTNFRA